MSLQFFNHGVAFLHFVLIAFILLCCVNNKVVAQHSVDLICSTTTANETRIKGVSNMFTGNVKDDYVLFERLEEGEDGEIFLTLNSFTSSGEDVKITLIDPNNSNVYFGMRLKNNIVTIEQKYDGILEEIVIGAYGNNDVYKVKRCQSQIIYYINSTMVNIFDLDNNDFKLAGEIDIVSGTNINFNSSVEFNKN